MHAHRFPEALAALRNHPPNYHEQRQRQEREKGTWTPVCFGVCVCARAWCVCWCCVVRARVRKGCEHARARVRACVRVCVCVCVCVAGCGLVPGAQSGSSNIALRNFVKAHLALDKVRAPLERSLQRTGMPNPSTDHICCASHLVLRQPHQYIMPCTVA